MDLADDGWRLVRPGPTDDRGVFPTFENYSDFPASRAGVVLSVWQATLSINDVAAAYRSEDLIEASTEPIPTSLAGLDAIRLDVRAAADRSSFEPCAGFAFSDGIGLETIPACAWSRIWIVDVDGFAVSVIRNVGRYDGEDFDPDSILPVDDAQPLLDGFINGLSFCTAATPSDD